MGARALFWYEYQLSRYKDSNCKYKMVMKPSSLVRTCCYSFPYFMCHYCKQTAVLYHYHVVNFLPNPHNRHPIAHPWGWDMGCLLWSHISASSVSYRVSFVSSKFNCCSIIIIAVLYMIWYLGAHFQGTWQYLLYGHWLKYNLLMFFENFFV